MTNLNLGEVFSDPLSLFVWTDGTVRVINKMITHQDLNEADKHMLDFAVEFLLAASQAKYLLEGRSVEKPIEKTHAYLRSLQGIQTVVASETDINLQMIYEDWIRQLQGDTERIKLPDIKNFFAAIRDVGLKESTPTPEGVIIHE